MAPTKKTTPSTGTATSAADPTTTTTIPKNQTPNENQTQTEEAANTAIAPSADEDVGQRLASALDRAQQIQNAVKELITIFKALNKDVVRLQKKDNKKTRRAQGDANTADNATPRKPSGFAKPTLLSKELCDFLSVPEDSKLARTEVTRLLNKYVKDNNLQDPVDKRTIRPDGKLQKVLNISGDAQLTYFNLQSHIKHHFIKGPEAAVSA
jgi:chromatin remodeling complex protein RSC6